MICLLYTSRRVRWKSHARCGVGENLEIISKDYLSLSSFFGNGASPSGVLEHPGVIKNPERVRDAWQRAYGGRNAHKVAVLEEGMKFTPIAIPNNEAQFLETRKFQIEEIARMYRVPLHMIVDLDLYKRQIENQLSDRP